MGHYQHKVAFPRRVMASPIRVGGAFVLGIKSLGKRCPARKKRHHVIWQWRSVDEQLHGDRLTRSAVEHGMTLEDELKWMAERCR